MPLNVSATRFAVFWQHELQVKKVDLSFNTDQEKGKPGYCFNAGNLHSLETGHEAPDTHPIIITLLLYITVVAQISCINTFKTYTGLEQVISALQTQNLKKSLL